MASIWPMQRGNGIATYREILQRALMQREHEVEMIWHDGARPVTCHSDGREITDGALAERVDPKIEGIDARVRWAERRRYIFELACGEGVDLGRYDVIHTQDAIASRAIARVLPKGVAQVATLHGSLVRELEIGMSSQFDELMRHYFAREEYLGATSPHRTIVPSEALRRQMAELSSVPLANLQVMPYGLDIDDLQSRSLVGDSPNAAAGRIVLLCPARLTPVKGHVHLIAALHQVVHWGKNVELWLAGEGDLEGTLREQVNRLGLADRVRFLGQRDDVPALIRQCDVVVLASTQEVLSFSLLEAQALGKPVAATRALGIPEAVEDGVTGLLCEPGEPDQLALVLQHLVSDPGLRVRLGENGVKRARMHFTVNRMVDEVLTVYRGAIASARALAGTVSAATGADGTSEGYVIPDPAFWPQPNTTPDIPPRILPYAVLAPSANRTARARSHRPAPPPRV